MAGMRVHIGSRVPARGEAAAAEVSAQVAAVTDGRAGVVSGHGNAEAAALAEVAFVTVPFEGQRGILPELAETLAGRVVVSTAVPISFSRERGPEAIAVPEGSAAEQAAALLARSRVVAGFHSLSSSVLAVPERPIDAHVIITGDDQAAKATAMALAELLAGVRAVDGGPLRYARQSEALTVLLLSINRIYRRHAGVIVTDLP
jgi:NADPH-dependent F420 reductase